MNKPFKDFDGNIKLTSKQREDAETKYDRVCKAVHKKYYDSTYNGSTKFLFGSYKLHTSIRPITSDQDVDVLFRIPQDVYERFNDYESNGQSALLDEIRKELKKTFTTTDKIKAWGKVILVEFSEHHHNVELLPAYEREDGTFEIPNTEDGGSWEVFDPVSRINEVNQSDMDSEGYSKQLIRAMKRWRNNTNSLSLKSYRIEDLAISFISETSYSRLELSRRMLKFFEYIKSRVDEADRSHVDTAISRAEKAIDYESTNQLRKASKEWQKIFGSEFPTLDDPKEESQQQSDRSITNHPRPYLADYDLQF